MLIGMTIPVAIIATLLISRQNFFAAASAARHPSPKTSRPAS
jgi:hypothetical protein